MPLYNKAIKIQYVGTNYSGWQCQSHANTIQEEIQKALKLIYKNDITAIGSGRTDSGVHALGQVASFRTENYIKNDSLAMGMNSILPGDISVIDAWDVPEDFSAQLSAKNKTYLYKVYHGSLRHAFYENRSWWVKGKADFDRAADLLRAFEGTHDFTACCCAESLRENCVRTVNFTKFYKEGELFCLEVNGNGFLHNMVRIIAGTVIKGCKSLWTTDRIREMIETKNRAKGGPTAPAAGLYLKEVIYL